MLETNGEVDKEIKVEYKVHTSDQEEKIESLRNARDTDRIKKIEKMKEMPSFKIGDKVHFRHSYKDEKGISQRITLNGEISNIHGPKNSKTYDVKCSRKTYRKVSPLSEFGTLLISTRNIQNYDNVVVREGYKKMPTKQLLSLFKNTRIFSCDACYYGGANSKNCSTGEPNGCSNHYTEMKAELSTRPHVPKRGSKIQAKKKRQDRARKRKSR